jgi:PAS domain S-box-containing protein
VETSKEHSQARRYLVALLAPAVVSGVILLTWPLFQGSPVALFLLAIMFTAWYGGFRPGLLSVLTSLLLADYFFVAPFSLGPTSRNDFIRLVVMTIVGFCCSVLSNLAHRSRRLSEFNLAVSKRAEDRLREYEKVVEGLEEMIVVVDRDYRYLIANRAFLKQRDLKKEQVVGHLIADVLGEEYFENTIKDKLDRCFQREIVKFDTRFTYPRLGERDLFISYLPIEGPAGIDRVACVLADRTEARRAEKAHREAESKYRDIFENAGEGIFQSTPEGQYVAANPALARMHGFDSPEELIRARNDISNQIYVDPSQRVEFKRLLEQHGTVHGFEHQIFRKDGSKIWISVNARAVRDDQGTVMYYEGTAHEITERKRAEDAMSKLAAIVESTEDAIVGKTLDGAISSWNQGAERIYGYPAEEVIGAPVSILVPPNRIDELANNQEKIRRGEAVEHEHYETERVRKDGQIINVSLTVSPIRNADGLVIGASTIARNITARKRNEAEISALLTRELQLRSEAEVMRDANIALTKDLSLENVLKTLLGCLSKLVPYDSANVMLLDNDGQFVVSALSGYENFGEVELSRTIRLDPNSNPLLRQICATRQSVLVGDTRVQPGWQSVSGARHVRNWIGVPLVAYGQVIGLYSLDKAEPHVFKADQVRLAETMAAQAASAIQNAQLFRAAQHHSAELEERIAEQKQAEAALRASEHQLRLFNLATNDMFWNWDFLTGRVTRSMNFERAFGYSEVEIGPTINWWEERLHPDDKERVLNEFRTALERGHKSCVYEYRFRRHDGSYATISDRAYIARDQSGNGVRAIGAMTDITERKQAEAALRQSEERYRDLVENSR